MLFLDRALTNARRTARFGEAGTDTNLYPASGPVECSNAAPDGYIAGYYTNGAGTESVCIWIVAGSQFPASLPTGTPGGLYPRASVAVTPNPTPTPTPIIITPAPMTTIRNFYSNNPGLTLGIAAAAAYFLFIKK